ncbi:MAG: Smr/MutS family protein [Deltaproteobacteria bacterium]|nr:Smr/MutS family protein [Deltaproteobacteria bacterium]
MSGVKRLGPGGSKPRKKPPAPASAVRAQTSGTGLSTSDDDDEVMNNLRDLVEGRAPLDFTDSDEFVEGRAADCSRLDLSRLRDGVFAIQDTLDLHGHNREEAFAAVLGFFAESLKRGYRCVNVICGRGLHTPGGVPVLKELLVRWLVQGRLSYNVLAFSSAKRHDGGVGAIYVLLRRNPKRV